MPHTFEGTTTALDTAGNIINDAAAEVGLEPVSDPFSSNDPNFVQLCVFLKSLGRELWREKQWSQLNKEHTFVTTGGDGTYPLPDDFGYMINQTGWNRSTREPLGGPLSPQEWQYVVGFVGLTVRILFRPLRHQLYLYPDSSMPDGQTIAFEYISRFWVQTSGAAAPDADTVTASSDVVWFDPLLAMRGLKLQFLKAKSFDTSAAQDDYQRTLDSVMGDDAAAPVYCMDSRAVVAPLITNNNIPLTGFG